MNLGLTRTIPVSASCVDIVINSTPSSSQDCPNLMINNVPGIIFEHLFYTRHRSDILLVLTSQIHNHLTKQVLLLAHFRDDEIEAESLRNCPVVSSLQLVGWNLNPG